MNFNAILKRILPHVVAVVLFLIVLTIFFYPMFKGMDMYQHDIVMVKACSQDINAYRDAHDAEPLWTGDQFSGMPTYGISQRYPKNLVGPIEKAMRLGLPYQMGLMFLLFVSFYILLLSFKVNPWLAIVGALAYGLSTYWFVALGAGHNSKMRALDFVAVVLAGVVVAYRGRILWGSALAALGTALQLNGNHFQITYYLLLVLIFYGLSMFILHFLYRPYERARKDYMKEKGWKHWDPWDFGKFGDKFQLFGRMGKYVGEAFTLKDEAARRFLIATGALLVAALVGVGPNAGKLLVNKEYADETIRGKASELSAYKDSSTGPDGLDKYYALSWSYDKPETFNLMIPGFYGGSSSEVLSTNSNIYEEYFGPLVDRGQMSEAQAEASIKRMPMYWGSQTFTSGPVYIGVIMCFLFFFGMFTVRGPIKWGLVALTGFATLLAWGINLEGFNVWMLEHLPLYNKFRAVSMTLVIHQLTIPLLGMLGLSEFFKDGLTADQKKSLKLRLFVAAGLSLFILFFWLVMGTSIFDFKTERDAPYLQNTQFYNALVADRISLFRGDILRGIALVAVFAAAMLAYIQGWVKGIRKELFAGAFALLVLVDMVPVDMRYMGADKFVEEMDLNGEFPLTTADQQILQDKDPHYRVFYANWGAVWKDASVSYRHKSIGGYSAVKLRKYQELYEQVIAHPEGNPEKVLNMLNAKWIMQDDQNRPLPNGRPDRIAQRNPNALGNAWFPGEIKKVSTEDEVILEMRKFDPAQTAVVNTQKIGEHLNGFTPKADPTATVKLDSYQPNHLKYSYKTASEQFMVFSEIYYPHGWNAYLDGKGEPMDYVVVNYVLRGMRVPAGSHTLEWKFEPKTFETGGNISLIFSIILLLGVVGIGGLTLKNWVKEVDEEELKAIEKSQPRKRKRPASAKKKPVE